MDASVVENYENSSSNNGLDNTFSNSSMTKFKADEILCVYCKRTLTNKIRCLGMCVAENEY